jgi:hypothetical protein
MTSRSLRILHISSWIALLASAGVLFFLAIASPNVISAGNEADRERNVKEIRESTDLHEVQQIAVWRTQETGYISQSARILLIISVCALMLCMVCAGLNLFQIGRLKAKSRDEGNIAN